MISVERVIKKVFFQRKKWDPALSRKKSKKREEKNSEPEITIGNEDCFTANERN
jgi:hypothetical protein